LKRRTDRKVASYDYTKGNLMELIDIIVSNGAKLFVSAVGIPPKEVVGKLHAGGVLYMNMIGHPKHIVPAINAGADLICAQGSEAGGHTGDVPTSILIPAAASIIGSLTSVFTGEKVMLVAAGGLYNGRSLAGALMLGADAVWIGTRFLLAEESGASRSHQREIQSAGFEDLIKTTIFTGRPMHVKANKYVRDWEGRRREEKLELQKKGVIPVHFDVEKRPNDDEVAENEFPVIMGKVAGVLGEIQSARAIVDEMVEDAVVELRRGERMISKL
jgi:NAD(P)H-dependent flavin oxidoreductase YrpB (nitropropane dioxygenase family)